MTGRIEQGASRASENPLQCSIVIRAYNEEKHIGRLLAGIQEQTVKNIEIILVDSGSSDATTTIAARYPVQIVYIHPEDFSFGRSLNQGIARAQSEFIVIASAHVYPVYPDWLERLLAPFVNPQVALTYGKQRGTAETNFSEHQIFAQWYPDQSKLRQSHPFCNNANAAIRRSLWETRPYDESLSGLEDLEWAHWAMEQGYSIAYIAEAETIHVHRETPGAIYNRYKREAMAFKRIFPHESFTWIDFLRLLTTNILSDLRDATRQGLLRTSLRSILWFRWVQFLGTFHGYRHAGPLTWQLRQTFYYPRRPVPIPEKGYRNVQPIQYHDVSEKP